LASADRFRVTDSAHSNLVAEEIISDGHNDILLYISNDYPDQNEIASKFTKLMRFEKCDYQFDDRYCSIYYCQK